MGKFPLEFKTFSSYYSWEDSLQTATDIGKYQRCTFGDDLFKTAVGNVGYKAQLLHHALVLKAKKVLYVAAGRNEIAYMTLVYFPEDSIRKYFGVLDKFAVRYLKWTFPGTTEPFPKDQLSDSGLAQGNHDVNIHTVQLHFSIWKQLHKMIIVKSVNIKHLLYTIPQRVSTV